MLDKILQKRLAEFVDRDAELGRFCNMLDGGDKPIMVVWGGAGIGKTSLLARMIHECAIRKLHKSEIVWKDYNPPDYMAIMRKIRDDIGPEHFNDFTSLIEYYTKGGDEPRVGSVGLTSQQSVAAGARIDHSKVGDIAGTIIKDSMIVVFRPDLGIPESERCEKLTAGFIECLARTVKQWPTVVFMDAVEKMSPDTERWVWHELLERVMQLELPNLKFVLCGRKPPPQNRDWDMFIETAGLMPLASTDIVKYLTNRQISLDDKGLAAVAFTILNNSKGLPIEVARQVDALEQMMRSSVGGHT
jgi:hypothetical protein